MSVELKVAAQKIIDLDGGKKNALLRSDPITQARFLTDKKINEYLVEMINKNNKLWGISKLLLRLKIGFYSLFKWKSNYAKTGLKIAKLYQNQFQTEKNYFGEAINDQDCNWSDNKAPSASETFRVKNPGEPNPFVLNNPESSDPNAFKNDISKSKPPFRIK